MNRNIWNRAVTALTLKSTSGDFKKTADDIKRSVFKFSFYQTAVSRYCFFFSRLIWYWSKYFKIIGWGWVWYKKVYRSRRVLSAWTTDQAETNYTLLDLHNFPFHIRAEIIKWIVLMFIYCMSKLFVILYFCHKL